MSEKRSFKVESVTTVRGCPTKFNHDSRYMSTTPVGAAKKAHTYLCNRKNIKGACTLIVTVTETTRDSKGKSFTYKVTRRRLSEPVVLKNGATFQYETTAHKHGHVKKSAGCAKQSKGVMRKHSVKSKKSRKRKSYYMNQQSRHLPIKSEGFGIC